MKKYFCVTALLFNILGGYQLRAQSAKDELAQLMRDDSVDVNTIAIYSTDVRESIFKVSSHPEGVVKLKDIQNKSNESFKNLVASYSKEDQQKIWNLTRYNNLISELALAKGKKKKTEGVLKKFPIEVHDDAFAYAVNHYELIVGIDKVNKEFTKDFQAIISGYSSEDQAAFHSAVNTPEAFNLLNQNMHLTVHLGDIYKTDPSLLRRQFDSLNIMVAEQNAREKEEWKQEMKQNPEAQKEMKQSAEQYARDNGYTEKDLTETDPKVVEHYVYVPYPVWCGYPWWYADPYWYPYPYWYHWGFYYWHGDMVWMGPPSWYFVHWHFHNHHHFYDYPHLTNVYINHYYGPRRSMSRNSIEVHSWVSRNESSLPHDFKTNQDQRIDRIREIGKSEIDRENFNTKNPDKKITREEFIKQNPKEYPHLQEPIKASPTQVNPPEPKSPSYPINIPDKKNEQPIKTDRSVKPPVVPPRIPSAPPRMKEQPKPRIETPRTQPSVPKQNPAPAIREIPKKAIRK